MILVEFMLHGQLVRDRESFMALLVGCHDQHVSTIIAKVCPHLCILALICASIHCPFQEDELTSQENKRCAAFSKEPRLQERLRNRERVVEIQEVRGMAWTFSRSVSWDHMHLCPCLDVEHYHQRNAGC